MNGVSYAFQVRTVNAAGVGPASARRRPGVGPASDVATAVTPAVQTNLWSATLTVQVVDGDFGCGGGATARAL